MYTKKFIFCIAIMLLSSTVLISSGHAANRLINFQGRLTDQQGNPLDGTYDIVFSIYASATDTKPLWTEEHEGVSVSKGLVNVLLGSITSFEAPKEISFDEDRYLGITIDCDNNPYTQEPEMLPRQKILPAIYAHDADKLDGKHSYELAPPGMIAMFMKSCPVGWTEFLQMRGRFPRGEPNGNPGSLGSGGSDDATLVKHTHSARASDPGPHKHSGSTDFSGAHTHNYYDAWYSEINCAGDGSGKEWYGSHSSDYDNHLCLRYEETKFGGDHIHPFSTNYSGSHTHTIKIDSAGSSGKNDNIPRYQEVIFCIKD